MKKSLLFIVTLFLLTHQFISFGCPGGYTCETQSIRSSNDQVYAGLKWTLNEGMKPEVLLGVRHEDMSAGGHTYGGDVSLSAQFIDGFKMGQAKIKYLNGSNNIQGEVGTGYDFTHGLFLSGGMNGPYMNLGADYLIKQKDKALNPFLMLDTLKNKSIAKKIIYIPVGPC